MIGRKHGRKSAGSTVTSALSLGAVPRVPLPPELLAEEAEVYVQVVNNEAAEWFSPANQPLLVQYCRHVVTARRLSEILESITGQRDTQWPFYASLLDQQRRESGAIAMLAQKMRLSQSATRNARGHDQVHQPQVRPPWIGEEEWQRRFLPAPAQPTPRSRKPKSPA